MQAIRLLVASLSVALSACATDTASRAELFELTASVRAMRAENARLEARLDKLEQQGSIARVRAATQSSTPAAHRPNVAPDDLPELTVVKLKPKREPAPPIHTNINVQEPAAALAEALTDAPLLPKEAQPDEADAAVAETQYDQGMESLKTGNVEGGIAQLRQFSEDWPRHPRADNALYFSGVGLASLGKLDEATTTFEATISRYPAGDAIVDSMLKLAECRMKLNQPRAARAAWQKVVASYPGTAAATQAQARLASLSSAH